MDQFLVETPHRAKDCTKLVQDLETQGNLTQFDWGCESGLHPGWAVLVAKNEAEARLAAPPLVRDQARVVKVSKLDAGTLAQLDKDEMEPSISSRLQMHRTFPCWW